MTLPGQEAFVPTWQPYSPATDRYVVDGDDIAFNGGTLFSSNRDRCRFRTGHRMWLIDALMYGVKGAWQLYGLTPSADLIPWYRTDDTA